ncbi:hypothetical protein [Deminuibacter soli]|nr:hypothetical protein [Deminuibacter soli]
MIKSAFGKVFLVYAPLLCILFWACTKNGSDTPGKSWSVSFTTGTGNIVFPQAAVIAQPIGNVHTTLISGGYADTSRKQGSISIRVIGGDTTTRYTQPNVLVTYTDSTGATWTSTTDTTNAVTFYQFGKTPGAQVHGSFNCIVSNKQGATLILNNGNFTAPYTY